MARTVAGRSAARRDNAPVTVVLDDIDKAIIRELQVDGRTPYAKLGPAVGLSQAAVRQRVQRLIDSGVMQVVAVTDPQMLGFSLQAMIGLQIEGDVRPVAATLAAIERVEYVVVATGRYDILIEVVADGSADLLDFLNDSVRAVAGVRHAEVFTYLQLEKQTYSWGTR